jgi:DNA polymerase III subunit delta'
MPFRDLVGHRTVLSLLARAIDAGTLPPSLIFGGPEGVGKRQAALALAQALNCPTPLRPVPWPDAPSAPPLAIDACGSCATCSRIGRGIHPDLIVITPGETGNIPIKIVREKVLQEVGFKPFEARRRVVIFDGAEGLQVDAQDALLKTLEEPPPGSVLVLVTAQPGQLLPTVRSRCPTVRFAPLANAAVVEWLMKHEGLAEGQARAVASVARGSLAAARAAASEAEGQEGYRAAAVRVLQHVSDAGDARRRLEATRDIVGKGKGSGASERDSLANHLHALAALLRDLAVLATRADVSAVVNVDLVPPLQSVASFFDRERILRAFTAVDRALGALERNASPKTVADWVVLQL